MIRIIEESEWTKVEVMYDLEWNDPLIKTYPPLTPLTPTSFLEKETLTHNDARYLRRTLLEFLWRQNTLEIDWIFGVTPAVNDERLSCHLHHCLRMPLYCLGNFRQEHETARNMIKNLWKKEIDHDGGHDHGHR